MDTGEKVLKEGERDRLQGALRGATINVPSGMDPSAFFNLFSAEAKELHNLAQTFCDQAIRQGKQEEAIKAIAKLIADQGVIHGAS